MFDIAIIGGGPGGYVAAEKAGKNGLKTILQNIAITYIEQREYCHLQMLTNKLYFKAFMTIFIWM